MVRLYIKQKVFSIGDKYDVMDENGQPVFYVKGEVFTLGAKIHLYDMMGTELYFIQRKLFKLLPEYHIFQENNLCATVKKGFSILSPKLSITSQYGNYTFEGNLFGMDFTILINGSVIGELHKKWVSWGDSYELIIEDENNAAFFCALSIAIDNCFHNENK